MRNKRSASDLVSTFEGVGRLPGLVCVGDLVFELGRVTGRSSISGLKTSSDITAKRWLLKSLKSIVMASPIGPDSSVKGTR